VQAELEQLAAQATAIMTRLDGIIDLESSDKADKPSLDVRMRRELASEYGVTLAQVGAALRPLLAGEESALGVAPTGSTTIS